jgi:hypothetical protein
LLNVAELTVKKAQTSAVDGRVEAEILRRRERPRSVLSRVFITLLRAGCSGTVALPKGLKAEAVGDSLETMLGCGDTKGSLSIKLLAAREVDAASLAAMFKPLRIVGPEAVSSRENAVKRVSGVPLKESAPPLDERGEDGLKVTP